MNTTTHNRTKTSDGFYVYPAQPAWNPANDEAEDTSVYNFCTVIRAEPLRLVGMAYGPFAGTYDVREEAMVGTLYIEINKNCTVYATPNWEDPDDRPGLALSLDTYDENGNQDTDPPCEYVLVDWTGNCATDRMIWQGLVAAFIALHCRRVA